MFVKFDQSRRNPLDIITFDEFIGAIFSERRVEKGLSKQSLANLLNITAENVKDIETGSIRPSAGLLIQIASIFELSLSDLLAEYAYLFDESKNTQAYGNVIFLSKKSRIDRVRVV